MVSDNHPDQYFQFVKMLLEEVISEPLIHSVYYVNQNSHHSGFEQSNVAVYIMMAYAVGMYCYARAGREIFFRNPLTI